MGELANLIVEILEGYQGYRFGWLNRNPITSALSMTIVKRGGAPEDKIIINLEKWYMDSLGNPYTIKKE